MARIIINIVQRTPRRPCRVDVRMDGSSRDTVAERNLMEEIYGIKKAADRADKLHEAEAILMEDMPVIPVVFNKSAYLVNDNIDLNNSKLFGKSKTSCYYATGATLRYVNVDNYDKYLTNCAAFLESKYEAYKENPLSYFGSETYSILTFEEFKEESSNYAYFFKERKTEK